MLAGAVLGAASGGMYGIGPRTRPLQRSVFSFRELRRMLTYGFPLVTDGPVCLGTAFVDRLLLETRIA